MREPVQGVRIALMAALAMVCAGVSACGSSSAATSKTGLSAGFKPAADELRRFVDEKLAQARDEATHDSNAAEARRQLADLRPKAATEADRNVFLLLAMLMSKDNQRTGLVFMARKGGVKYEIVQSDISALYQAREACNSELLGWLGHKSADLRTLERGSCLLEAQQAAAILGK
jgi:hypothetical protein